LFALTLAGCATNGNLPGLQYQRMESGVFPGYLEIDNSPTYMKRLDPRYNPAMRNGG
jgi:hypothetical protein